MMELATISEFLLNTPDMCDDFYEDMDIGYDLETDDLDELMEWNPTSFEVRKHKMCTGTHKTNDNFE